MDELDHRIIVSSNFSLSSKEIELLSSGRMKIEQADIMIENVVGMVPIPIGLAEGIVVNDKEYIVPMATEQRSIISLTSSARSLKS